MLSFLKSTLFLVALLIKSQVANSQVFQENCAPSNFVVDTLGAEINWQQFPDFELPFNVVYHGNSPSDSLLHPLKHGFSHVVSPDNDFIDTLLPHLTRLHMDGNCQC